MTPELEQLIIQTALEILRDDDANPDVGMGMSIGTAVEMAIAHLSEVSKVVGRGGIEVKNAMVDQGRILIIDAQAIVDKIYAIKYPGLTPEQDQLRRDALPRMRVQIELEGPGVEGLKTAESMLMLADYPPRFGELCGSYEDPVLKVQCSWRFIKEKGM